MNNLESSSQTSSTKCVLNKLMGQSADIERVINEVEAVAKTDFCVLILGESGVGKELVATTIHRASLRSKGPFIPIDCGAIPDTLFESELFGHEKGAFTGAANQKLGKFELAHGGTLFLDEITNLTHELQGKLMRVLQEKVIYRVGGIRPILADVRVIVASNEDLTGLASSRQLRHDLFFRVNEFAIKLPTLRSRKEDIPWLVNRFLQEAQTELRKTVQVSKDALPLLMDYEWPGNVRELRSTIRRATLLANGEIHPEHLDIIVKSMPGINSPDGQLNASDLDLPLKTVIKQKVAALEREIIRRVMLRSENNKAKTARILQIDYKTLLTKIKQYSINN